MFKTLLKKQFLEINKGFILNRKTGKSKSPLTIAITAILYAAVIALVAFSVFYVAKLMCVAFIETNLIWLYFALMSVFAVILGVFGSVFNTYSMVFLPKDNDLLLSMPIPVRTILNSRLTGVYLMGLFYSAIVFIPSLLVYYIYGAPSAVSVITSLVLFFTVSVMVTVLSCAFGFIVAAVIVRLKNKSVVTVILALLFISLYYFLYFKASDAIEKMVESGEVFAGQVKTYAYPLYALGKAGEGDWIFTAADLAISLALFFLVYFLMSKKFLSFSTTKSGAKKVSYNGKKIKVKGVKSALLAREFKRYLSSASYILNCSMATLFMVAAAIFFAADGANIREFLNQPGIDFTGFVAPLAAGITMLLSSMNYLTAPSVSLEGKTLWIIRSLPIKTWDVFKAKIALHLILTSIPSFILSLTVSLVLRLNVWFVLLVVALSISYTVLSALFGLFLGLKFPNLTWVNESVIFKRGATVFFSMIGGWAFVAALAFIFVYVSKYIPSLWYLVICLGLVVSLSVALWIYLKRKGTDVFERL